MRRPARSLNRETLHHESLHQVERLESRVALDAAGAGGGSSAPPLAAIMPQPVVLSTVPVADSLHTGRTVALATPERAYAFSFATGGAAGTGWQTRIDVDIGRLPTGMVIDLEVVGGLTRWDGVGTPSFVAAPAGVAINLAVSGADLRVSSTTSTAPRLPAEARPSITVGVADGRPFRQPITASIGRGGIGADFVVPGATTGIYAFTGMWSVAGSSPGGGIVRDSLPVSFVFSIGAVPAASVATAVDWLSAPATRPIAIVDAVARTLVSTATPQVTTIVIDTQWSDPVRPVGAGALLPVAFDGRQRFAQSVSTTPPAAAGLLAFRITPTLAERSAQRIALGPSIRPAPGGSIEGIPILGVPTAARAVLLSLPGGIAVQPPAGVVVGPQVVAADIVRNTTWRAGTTYLIDGEVHVRRGVTLTIENGVTVLIRNGRKPLRTIDTSALIFDSGSALRAATVTFASADLQGRETPLADNGGVFFCGTTRAATKDGITSVTGGTGSSFVADLVVARAIGRTDPQGGDGDDNDRDDIDAISVIGIGPREWRIASVRTERSGDDGFDATASTFTLDSLVIVDPVEDGLNVTSSFITIRKNLSIVMTASTAPDRELFDFEVDQGPVKVLIQRGADVDLRGIWGGVDDGVNLNSPDMPPPPRRRGAGAWYEFQGKLVLGPAIVFSSLTN